MHRGGTHILVTIHSCLLDLLVEGVGNTQETLISQLLIKGLHECVHSGEWHVGEVSEILSNGDVQRVWSIEYIGVCLQPSSSIMRLSSLGVSVNRVQDVL